MRTSDRPKSKFRIKTIILCIVFIVVFFGSFMLGRYPIMPDELIRILLSRVFDVQQTWPEAAEYVVFNIRLPRVLAAGLVGASLAVAGVCYQGMFQNPMVSPGILGASSGAGCGAALAILLGFNYYAISLNAFIFGLGAVMLAYGISRISRINPILAMVLAGMLISSLFSAGTSFIKLVADTQEALPAITYWLMGSMSSVTYKSLLFGVPFIIIGLVVIWALKWRLNILSLNEDEAKSMGMNIKMIRLLIIVASSLITASVISMCGQIGWVGLLIPHISRMLLGSNNKTVVPLSISFGAIFMAIIDTFARSASSAEIPISILTAIIGAPVFISLLRKTGGVWA